MPPILYLIDGHALAYRTYFALTAASQDGSRWQTSSGEPTAGVYGFTSVLLRLLEQEKPEYLAVAFDAGHSFRDKVFSGYKATRAKMPDDLRPQMKRIRQLVEVFNIPRLEVEGYEADDVLGSIARQAVEQGMGVKIITGDRDLLQLVSDRVIVNLAGAKLSEAKDFLPEDVVGSLGVRPEQVVDYKALVGDKSDNIPGVDGIGEKTATSLLSTYATLDEIYAHIGELSNRVNTRLEAGRDSAYLSQDLARIRTNVPITIDLKQAETGNYDPQAVEALFRELEFRSLITRFNEMQRKRSGMPPQAEPVIPAALPIKQETQQLSLFGDEIRVVPEPPAVTTEIEIKTVDSPSSLEELKGILASAKVISFDTETTSTDPMRADLVGISLAVRPGQGFYIPVGHKPGTGEQLPLASVLDALRPAMTDPNIPKVGHNLKYDFILLARNSIRVDPISFDTMIAEWLINPASHNLGLKNLAWIRLEREMTHIEDLIGKGKNQISMAEVPVARAAAYAGDDAEATLRLMDLLKPELDAQNCSRLLDEMEMPLICVLADMEMAGIAVDVPLFQQMSEELRKRMAEIEMQIYEAVGSTFNLNSTQQLSVMLFDRLRLEPPDRRKKTASGHYSTSADVLDELRGKHPVVDWILEYRELAKLKSTYVDALPQQVNPVTGRIHTSYNQTGSVTGRLASSEPNLQNIPTRTDLGRKVRLGFIASPGKVLLSIDYSQIELRLVAAMSKDEAMLEAFRAGQDIHTATAAAIYGIPISSVSKDQRRNAKGINFGLIYGMSPFGLSRATDLTLAEAEDFSRTYFRQFPGVKHYLDGLRRQATDQGYVETLFGRRRYFPGLKTQTNPNLRNREEREAINAPIQGTAADIMKIAMERVPKALKDAGLSSQMLLQVHDELVLETSEAELAETARIVQHVMETACSLEVPLTTEARCGKNWGELKPLPK